MTAPGSERLSKWRRIYDGFMRAVLCAAVAIFIVHPPTHFSKLEQGGFIAFRLWLLTEKREG